MHVSFRTIDWEMGFIRWTSEIMTSITHDKAREKKKRGKTKTGKRRKWVDPKLNRILVKDSWHHLYETSLKGCKTTTEKEERSQNEVEWSNSSDMIVNVILTKRNSYFWFLQLCTNTSRQLAVCKLARECTKKVFRSQVVHDQSRPLEKVVQ